MFKSYCYLKMFARYFYVFFYICQMLRYFEIDFSLKKKTKI